jgi:starvation-inducible DNA-binding protein
MKTDIGLKDNARQAVADTLGKLLADTYVLTVKTQNFHWNVTGPHFPYLHTLFQQQYEELSAATDEIAERIRALGHHAPGTMADFLKLASVKEPAAGLDADAMVGALLADHEAILREARGAQRQIQEAGDEESSDLVIGRLAAHGKAAWMLRVQVA